MYRIKSDQVVYSMSSKHLPVLKVESGATVVFETCDCFENQVQTSEMVFTLLDWDRINPATGPVYIDGAEPGDTIAVRIDDIKVGKQGAMITGPGLGVIGDSLDKNVIKIIPIQDGKIKFSEKINLPVNPMIGVIGTAPANESISCGTPGFHGGNMDTKIIGIGATVYLPVEVHGALLAMGDLHASMGDGEVSVCGIEVPGEVTVTITLIKGRSMKLPVVLTDNAIYTIASDKSLDEAAALATRNMVDLLTTKGLSKDEAIQLLSVGGNLQISQVVDPLKTVRFELPLWIYKSL
jgi:amidase